MEEAPPRDARREDKREFVWKLSGFLEGLDLSPRFLEVNSEYTALREGRRSGTRRLRKRNKTTGFAKRKIRTAKKGSL